jgi:hypothetical protein
LVQAETLVFPDYQNDLVYALYCDTTTETGKVCRNGSIARNLASLRQFVQPESDSAEILPISTCIRFTTMNEGGCFHVTKNGVRSIHFLNRSRHGSSFR